MLVGNFTPKNEKYTRTKSTGRSVRKSVGLFFRLKKKWLLLSVRTPPAFDATLQRSENQQVASRTDLLPSTSSDVAGRLQKKRADGSSDILTYMRVSTWRTFRQRLLLQPHFPVFMVQPFLSYDAQKCAWCSPPSHGDCRYVSYLVRYARRILK